MRAKTYQMRICAHGYKDKKKVYVSFSDETLAMFTKPYISVKRMQDRLAFMQWDTKTGQGFSAICNGMLRFAKQTDCEKMLDFCGEYALVTQTDNGIVFVKLEDRLPFTTVVTTATDGNDVHAINTETLVKTVPVSDKPNLSQLLAEEIEKKQKELAEISNQIDAIKNGVLRTAQERYEKVNNELRAYCIAYNMAKENT